MGKYAQQKAQKKPNTTCMSHIHQGFSGPDGKLEGEEGDSGIGPDHLFWAASPLPSLAENLRRTETAALSIRTRPPHHDTCIGCAPPNQTETTPSSRSTVSFDGAGSFDGSGCMSRLQKFWSRF